MERHDATRVHPQHLARAEVALVNRPAGMEKRPAIALQTLHDEAFTAKQPDADLLVERDADAHALGRAQERVLLGDQFAADLGQVDRNDFPGIRRAERHAFLAGAVILENGHEERFAREQAFARADECVEKSAALLRTVPEDRFHLDAVVHVHHAASLGDGGLQGIQFHFDVLHVVAVNFVIHFVHCVHGS